MKQNKRAFGLEDDTFYIVNDNFPRTVFLYPHGVIYHKRSDKKSTIMYSVCCLKGSIFVQLSDKNKGWSLTSNDSHGGLLSRATDILPKRFWCIKDDGYDIVDILDPQKITKEEAIAILNIMNNTP